MKVKKFVRDEKTQFGYVIYKNNPLILVGDPYLVGENEFKTIKYYLANAINDEEQLYKIMWDIDDENDWANYKIKRCDHFYYPEVVGMNECGVKRIRIPALFLKSSPEFIDEYRIIAGHYLFTLTTNIAHDYFNKFSSERCNAFVKRIPNPLGIYCYRARAKIGDWREKLINAKDWEEWEERYDYPLKILMWI